MFSKKENLESFVGRNTHVKGDISSKGTLRVDGRVTGNIESDWLVMGAKSFLKGDANASGVDVGGTIEGNIVAKEVVEVKNKGHVKGDIVTGKLLVEEGGSINGKIAMQQKDGPKVVELSPEKIKEA
jgi:cytoskeletal protein CcmA (bactofilin family)